MQRASRFFALLLLLTPIATWAAVEPAGFRLAAQALTPSCQAAASPALGVPDPRLMAGCTAEQQCDFGPDVSCTGDVSCSVHSYYVTCDGVTTSCYICHPDPECANPLEYCDCRAAGGTNNACYGYCV